MGFALLPVALASVGCLAGMPRVRRRRRKDEERSSRVETTSTIAAAWGSM